VGIIGVMLPQALSVVLSNEHFTMFLQGISSMCDEQALSVLTLSPMNGSLDQTISRSPVDGYIIVGYNESHHEVATLRKRQINYVVVDGDSTNAPSVNIDDEGGSYVAAKHLIDKGHRDILILMLETAFGHTAEQVHGVGMRRLKGYQRAFSEAGVTWRDEWIIPTHSSILSGEQSFDIAMTKGLRPTAILAASDVIGIGATQAATRHGYRVPNDIEVIGFDDITVSKLIRPSLSTVHQPIFEKGRMAVELLVEEIDPHDDQTNATHIKKQMIEVKSKHVVLPTHLVLRSTTL
jgi:alanine racemase